MKGEPRKEMTAVLVLPEVEKGPTRDANMMFRESQFSELHEINPGLWCFFTIIFLEQYPRGVSIRHSDALCPGLARLPRMTDVC